MLTQALLPTSHLTMVISLHFEPFLLAQLKGSVAHPSPHWALVTFAYTSCEGHTLSSKMHFTSQTPWSISYLSVPSPYSPYKQVCIINCSTNVLIVKGPLIPNQHHYSLDLHSAHAEHAFSTQHAVNLDTWHHRLGHANYQAIMGMAKSGTITGMPSTFPSKLPKCDSCILGKQTRTPVPKVREEGKGHRATWKLETVWVDLTGSMAVESCTGNKYVMNLIDKYTNKAWSIPLKLKSDSLRELEAWELAREHETRLKVSKYRMGYDGEHNSNQTKEWLRLQGTDHKFGAPYTSAHMGRVD